MKALAIFSTPELLETRIAPAVIFAVSDENKLLRFDSSAPDAILSAKTITGLADGETVLGMDFRPATFELYAVGSTGVLYRLDVSTAKAAAVSSLAADPTDSTAPFTALDGTSFGIDFNPVPDRLRVVSDGDQNVRVNPNTGLVTTDTNLAYGGSDTHSGANPQLVASAYTNSFASATTTTLYGIDSALNILVTQNPPNNGILNTVGGLGIDVTDAAGFDIEFRAGANVAFAALSTDGTSSSLYTINLTTGAATVVGAIGGTGTLVHGMAVAPEGFRATVNGSIATMTGGPLDDTLIIDSAGGLLRHNRFTAGDPGFNSDFDFDSILVGDQTLSASAGGAGLLIDGAGGSDTITVNESVALVDINQGIDHVTGASGFLKKNTLTYADADGDAVKLTVSKSTLSFSQFLFSEGAHGVDGLQLLTVSFTDSKFSHANLTATAKRSAAGGDNSVAIGVVNLLGLDFGAVNIAGDLGRIEVGDGDNTTPGLKSLTARSMGVYGLTSGATSLVSNITGSVAAITIRTDQRQAYFSVDGAVGKFTVGGSIFGGSMATSGGISAQDNIGSVSIGGSVIGGTHGSSATISTAKDIGSVKIHGSIVSTTGSTGSIIALGSIKTVNIGGDIISIGGSNAIDAGKQIGSVTIGGSVLSTTGAQVLITAANLAAPTPQTVAIKSVTVKGSAQHLDIRAGYSSLSPLTADAHIGTVTIGGDWVAGSIVAGVTDGGNGFGVVPDAVIAGGDPTVPSRIASIVIKGQAIGSTNFADHFGFVAEQIGSVKIGGATIPLAPDAHTDIVPIPIGLSGNLRILEV